MSRVKVGLHILMLNASSFYRQLITPIERFQGDTDANDAGKNYERFRFRADPGVMASQDVLRAAVVLMVHLIMCDSVMKKQPRISDLSL